MSTNPTCLRSTQRCVQAGLGTANIGLISDIIACPGMDYCALATARSIPVAQEIALRFDELKLEHEIGPLKIKISGCINACGHHHVGHIGILGLDRAGVENYQITLGGDGTETAAIGERAGPGFAYDEIVPAIERIIRAYLDDAPRRHRRPSSRPIAASAWRRSRPRFIRKRKKAACRLKRPQGSVADRVADLNRATPPLGDRRAGTRAVRSASLGQLALVSSFGAESVVLCTWSR